VSITITVFAIILLLLIEIFGIETFLGEIEDDGLELGLSTTATRLVGGIVFLTLVAYSGFRILSPIEKPFLKSLLFCLPAFAVALNNLPIYSLVRGLAHVTSPWWRVLLLALECFAVGLFEETCFRGFVFVGFLEKRRKTKRGQFMAIVLSSAVFAVVHLLNIFMGSSPIAVILQIGYSFLIGAMCAVMLMKTANIWLCVLVHGIFNFCGALIPNCGVGSIWEPFTVVITVVVSVIVAAYFVYMFMKINATETDRIYK
jgi:membrane protease YdiL (CAAX protease family)